MLMKHNKRGLLSLQLVIIKVFQGSPLALIWDTMLFLLLILALILLMVAPIFLSLTMPTGS